MTHPKTDLRLLVAQWPGAVPEHRFHDRRRGFEEAKTAFEGYLA